MSENRQRDSLYLTAVALEVIVLTMLVSFVAGIFMQAAGALLFALASILILLRLGYENADSTDVYWNPIPLGGFGTVAVFNLYKCMQQFGSLHYGKHHFDFLIDYGLAPWYYTSWPYMFVGMISGGLMLFGVWQFRGLLNWLSGR